MSYFNAFDSWHALNINSWFWPPSVQIMEAAFQLYHSTRLITLGPVVQSIFSLTMLLSKVLRQMWMLQNSKIFSCCSSYKQLLLQNISAFNIVCSESFKILFTTNYVSFKQSGPDILLDNIWIVSHIAQNDLVTEQYVHVNSEVHQQVSCEFLHDQCFVNLMALVIIFL